MLINYLGMRNSKIFSKNSSRYSKPSNKSLTRNEAFNYLDSKKKVGVSKTRPKVSFSFV